MKKLVSHIFGEVVYTDEEVYTFPAGLLGFPEYRTYVVHEQQATQPIIWLLSTVRGGPELALVRPQDISPRFRIADVPLDERDKERLQASDSSDLLTYAVVTLPENVKQISMNLRTPVLLNPETRRGIEYPSPGLENEPVRCFIYRELIASRPQDKPGNLLMHRKPGETIEIGDEISIRVDEIVNGGVRFVVTAPKSVKVQRGNGLVTPKQETIRANKQMNLQRLEALMRMHQVMKDPKASLPPTVLHPATSNEEQDRPRPNGNVARAPETA